MALIGKQPDKEKKEKFKSKVSKGKFKLFFISGITYYW